jgi:ketosteroid isomerase-like protein
MKHAAHSGPTDVALPEIVRRYLDAHDRHDTQATLSAFAPDAKVTDDGQNYLGADQIRDWLAKTASEFNYTRTFVSATMVDDDTWFVVNHLEGNFPGGVVDLRYRFVLTGGLISELVITP